MKRPAILLLIILALFFLTALVRSYILIRARGGELDRLRGQVDLLQGKVDEREGALSYYKSPEFIYKEALEQLGWTRRGEVIPDLPDWKGKDIEIEDKPAGSSIAAVAEPLPYWKRWRNLFFEN
ncbi:MAG: gwc1 protein [candidate division WWE3 bacterium CSP1-7]|uniref:Gwc1 protein n=1 Tax=candidate division WWE3 bacterium CSP1-7 TaxID=1576480 RepID=A0A0T5ZXM3_UNCKA|nr:MAG: gwc1 protein [candidate division WWE3 bacterium CSP1-7]